ncbi:ABC-2 type transport system ATP-binding protein [Thermostichus sp. MS-CIW-21]|jgi:ABC-2 type transport system ATP-binding protein|uniref:ABC transporter ATP-binding protein n=1 Tax=unclassified Synechococcus TaxID=2626047 RepID=UPI000069429B|nr:MULTISPECIES: ABC transporter ATP-binding protein [unclassified Synechococcus]ABC99245.1 ABC transporter, ATP-binding protein [Synechococcus sp. JA-3-3Ab]PIK85411.1 multidrug ABC transporter ATP-binding protein [Synechococcus sp. 63AY4M2]PIK88667.1 multidrug ABC transporter ATP-binding protein [Synechococcus sp. 65AY6A5]PIK89954.1 multidrug ABC transporter ATP-binding protein [Synechococcus sp. 65AY6Li]PIK94456.1 multidrug ABC transporter ATP-binding protein [Synechococcus sp. 60AY4M2]
MSETVAPSPEATDLHPEPAIAISGLTKTYRTGFWLNKVVSPLKDFSLTVARGETFGLLGPNGAGKTTTIKCLLGIVEPTSGRGTLLGKPLGDRSIKQRVGYLPENPYFYDYLTAWEFLYFAGKVFRLSDSLLKERIPQLLELVGLSIDTARKKQLRTYSKGMLQRTGMAQALINDPELVFLDEPMSGLDPMGRYQMREIILSLKQQGKTVFFNSHILGDVEVICNRVGLMVGGKLVQQGTLDELLGQSKSYHVQGHGGAIDQFRDRLEHFSIQGSHWSGEWGGSLPELLTLLSQAGAVVTDLHLQRQSLEEFFVDQVRAIEGDRPVSA